MSGKTVLIGLDGVPYGLMSDLVSRGVMPNTATLIKNGSFKKAKSSIPEISSVAWSSIITGVNPGQHGIFGFTDIPLGTYRLSFPNFNNLKAPPFWEKEEKRRCAIINVPSTFPVRAMNGVHIAGFVALDLERAVFPPSLISYLNEIDYRIDVDASKADESMDLFFRNLNRALDARIEAYRHVWMLEDWDVFMFVFTGTDRLSHFLWDAYEDGNHRYHGDFLNFFGQLDEVIGEITGRLTQDDLLILLSDHGFERMQKEVNVNALLRQAGFLNRKEKPKESYRDLDEKTRAFALDPGRIYLNIKQKYPRGAVAAEDYRSVVDDIFSYFQDLELDGKRIMKNIHRKEDIYEGPYMNMAPDLVLMSERGYNLKANLNAADAIEESRFKGKHTYDDAFILINKKTERDFTSKDLEVQDVLTIIQSLGY